MIDINQGLPAGRTPALRVPATPAHTNAGGDIFGGWTMSQIDIAGSIPAVLRAKGRVVTVAVNSIQFHEPVFVGDMLSLYADIIETGRTSITVDIDVFAQRNPANLQCVKVADARLTYVAVGDKGKRELPSEE